MSSSRVRRGATPEHSCATTSSNLTKEYKRRNRYEQMSLQIWHQCFNFYLLKASHFKFTVTSNFALWLRPTTRTFKMECNHDVMWLSLHASLGIWKHKIIVALVVHMGSFKGRRVYSDVLFFLMGEAKACKINCGDCQSLPPASYSIAYVQQLRFQWDDWASAQLVRYSPVVQHLWILNLQTTLIKNIIYSFLSAPNNICDHQILQIEYLMRLM